MDAEVDVVGQVPEDVVFECGGDGDEEVQWQPTHAEQQHHCR